MTAGRKIAVVLMNLGGPDSPEAVEPFLFNLFNDPLIIRVPGPVRWLIAKIVSRRRAPIARDIYANMGGKSPLLPETEDQARAIEGALADAGVEARAFIAMRYWHPLTAEAVAAVKAYGPDEIVLLPLYPQFSTTTTQSSIGVWNKTAKSMGLDAPARRICCYPTLAGFVDSHAGLIRKSMEQAGLDLSSGLSGVRVLFSAHGLPRKIVDAGDPYPVQVEATTNAIVEKIGLPGLDWRVTYQSRVGPLEWIGPDTEAEIAAAAREGKTIVVVPVAFVSEHSETLVELDIEYREIAEREGAAAYVRVPALGSDGAFINALGNAILKSLEDGRADGWVCPEGKTCFRVA